MTVRQIAFGREDRGSALIEFSLIGFVFIIVLLGVVEMGRMVLVYTTIANAARAGARYAIVHGGERSGTGVNGPSGPTCPCTQVSTVVRNYASAGLLNSGNVSVTVSYPDGINTAGSHVNVTASYVYDPLVTYFTPLLSTTLGSTSQGVITF